MFLLTMTFVQENNDLLGKVNPLAASLAEAQRNLVSKEKRGQEAYYEEKLNNDLKKIMKEKSDNAPTDSTTSGAAAEVVPAEVKTDKIVENYAGSKRYAFLAALSAGQVPLESKTTKYTLEAEGDNFQMATEWATGSGNTLSEPEQEYNVAQVSIEAKRQYKSVGITDELLTFGVYNTLNRVEQRNQTFVLRSVAEAVLNADSNTAATGNINSDDQLAATTWGAKNVLLGYNNSIRDNAIANGDTLSIGTPTNANGIFQVAKLLAFDSMPGDQIIIMDNDTYHLYMQLDDFKDMSKNGENSTISSGAITNIAGRDLFVTDLMRLTEADGKLSGATPSNNTKGQFAILDTSVIQHGFLGDVRTNVVSTLEKGVQFESTFYFGFDNISNKNDSRVLAALGINVG